MAVQFRSVHVMESLVQIRFTFWGSSVQIQFMCLESSVQDWFTPLWFGSKFIATTVVTIAKNDVVNHFWGHIVSF